MCQDLNTLVTVPGFVASTRETSHVVDRQLNEGRRSVAIEVGLQFATIWRFVDEVGDTGRVHGCTKTVRQKLLGLQKHLEPHVWMDMGKDPEPGARPAVPDHFPHVEDIAAIQGNPDTVTQEGFHMEIIVERLTGCPSKDTATSLGS
jgi:hypothetical protein